MGGEVHTKGLWSISTLYLGHFPSAPLLNAHNAGLPNPGPGETRGLFCFFFILKSATNTISIFKKVYCVIDR